MTMQSRSPLRPAGRCGSTACRGGGCAATLGIEPAALGRLMPLHVIVTLDGTILRSGPTVHKLLAGQSPVGEPFLSLFDIRMPREIGSVSDLVSHGDKPLRLALRDADRTGLKGQLVPLQCGQAVLIDLSFGISVFDAVRRFGLTSADFGGTDLGIEMLFLIEAQRAAYGETRRFTQRLERARKTAEAHAMTDGQTGLHNRFALDIFLAELAEQRAPFGLAYIDIDGFRAVNDLCGHVSGDAALLEFVKALKSSVRGEDIIARVGGDEFVVLLPGAFDERRQHELGRRFEAALSLPMVCAERSIRLTASIGMTASTHPTEEPLDAAMRRADIALRRAREEGGGKVRFEPAASAPSPPHESR